MDNSEVKAKSNGMSKASLIIGIVAMCTCFLPIVNNASFVMGILAAIFGIIALVKKQKKGKAIAGLVLGVLSVIITISLQNSWSKALDDLSNDLNTITGDNTEEVLKNNVDVTFGSFIGNVDEYGFTDTKLPVNVTNKSNEKKSFSIEIEAVDANGTRIDTDTIYISNLNPGQTQSETAFEFVSSDKVNDLKTAKFNVINVSMY